MNNNENTFDFRNSMLPTHNRRIRHLRSLAARNVRIVGESDISSLKLFFTLHTHERNPCFYKSEVIAGSLNPTWKFFSLDHSIEEVDTTKKEVVVRVWRENEDGRSLAVEWQVCLNGLLYFGNELQKEVSFVPNSLLFGMFGGYYVAPSPKDTPLTVCAADYTLSVDDTLVRKSYSVSTTDRIQTILRVIKQTDHSGRVARRNIESALSQSQLAEKKKAEREAVAMRVAMLHSELDWRTQRLRYEKSQYEQKQTTNILRERALQDRSSKLRNDRARLRDKKKNYFHVREDLIKTGAQLVMRRKQLISELTLIYPIQETPNGDFSIQGVILPVPEKHADVSETQLEVALGYTCHLAQMISVFLDVPLRYPMMHRGSKSIIHDHILEKLLDKERDFPLFSKGRERIQFQYGVYLINKNIAQLRYYCQLGTTDLRLSLANLKSLLQLRLGVKFDHLETNLHPHVTSLSDASVTSSGAFDHSGRGVSHSLQPVAPPPPPKQRTVANALQSVNACVEPVAINSASLNEHLKRCNGAQNKKKNSTERQGAYIEEEEYLNVSSTTKDNDKFANNATNCVAKIPETSDTAKEEGELFEGRSPDSFFDIQIRDAEAVEIETAQEATDDPTLNNDAPQTQIIPEPIAAKTKDNIDNNVQATFHQNSSQKEQNGADKNINGAGTETQPQSSFVTTLDTLQARIYIDYDARSMSSVTSSSKTNGRILSNDNEHSPSPDSQVNQVTKKKLRINQDENDVSSSEDSTNAAYANQFRFVRGQSSFTSLVSDNREIDKQMSIENGATGTEHTGLKEGEENSSPIYFNTSRESSNDNGQDQEEFKDKDSSGSSGQGSDGKRIKRRAQNLAALRIPQADLWDSTRPPYETPISPNAPNSSQTNHSHSDNTSMKHDTQRIEYLQQISYDSLIDSSPTF